MSVRPRSRTAESMAMFRALESARNPDERHFADPFAVQFLRPSMRFAIRVAEKWPAAQRGLVRLIDRRWPGARPSAVARTALIDSLMRDALRAGATQVVILGAGYDSRAYRIEEAKHARVFEVDRAGTQEFKRRRLERVLSPAPPQVVFVEADFLHQTLSELLESSGFGSTRKAFFIWEGVTQYLDDRAVDSTLRFVGGCAAGGQIAFTYIHRGLIDGSGTLSVSPNVIQLVNKGGEPWTFGFYPSDIRSYLRGRGLELTRDLEAIEYGALYTGATGREMKGYEFYHVALATIRGRGEASCRR
jgi:methyltransferase (TIGR00027 family)